MKTPLRFFMKQNNFERIPLKKTQTGHYKVKVKVNNNIGDFILDTGASASCMGFESAMIFNLQIKDSKVKAAGAGATNMETKIAVNNSICIGEVMIKKMNIVLFDLSHVNNAFEATNQNTVDGIIGADVLKKLRAVIDYGRNCLYISQLVR